MHNRLLIAAADGGMQSENILRAQGITRILYDNTNNLGH